MHDEQALQLIEVLTDIRDLLRKMTVETKNSGTRLMVDLLEPLEVSGDVTMHEPRGE